MIFVQSLSALCASPTVPENGEVIFTGTSVGNTATYFCYFEFELIGDAMASCTMSIDGNTAIFIPHTPMCKRSCYNTARGIPLITYIYF